MKNSLFLLTLIFSSVAVAATNDQSVLVIKKNPDAIYEDSSEFNRMNKQFSVVAQLVGTGPSVGPTRGVVFGGFLDRNSVLEFEIMSESDQGFNSSYYNVKTRSFGAHLKRFVSNSFYVRGGLDQRHVNYQYSYDSTGDGFDIRRGFEGSSTTASIAIGNQWQWSNFTMGCDWIGVALPISSQVARETFLVGDDVSDREKTYHSDEMSYYLTRTSAMGLRFYLGASF